MSSWSCPHQVNDICRKVAGAYCRPGMRGCVVVGKVTFQDGKVPYPVWPPGADPRARARAETDLCAGEGPGRREGGDVDDQDRNAAHGRHREEQRPMAPARRRTDAS